MRNRTAATALALAFLLTAPVAAQDRDDDTEHVTVEWLDGRAEAGRLEYLSADAVSIKPDGARGLMCGKWQIDLDRTLHEDPAYQNLSRSDLRRAIAAVRAAGPATFDVTLDRMTFTMGGNSRTYDYRVVRAGNPVVTLELNGARGLAAADWTVRDTAMSGTLDGNPVWFTRETGDPGAVEARASELVCITWGRGTGLSTGNWPMQFFHDGTRVRGHIKAVTDAGVQLQVQWFGASGTGVFEGREPVVVPIEQLRFVGLQKPDVEPAAARDSIDRLVNGPNQSDDVLVMVHGEAVSLIHCIVMGVDNRQVHVLWKNEEFRLDRSRVWGIRFAELPGATPPAPSGGGFMRIGSSQDEWIVGQGFLRRANDRSFVVLRPDGKRWNVAASYPGMVQFASDRVVPLTSLPMASVESSSLMGRSWPVRIGRSVRDTPIRLQQQIHADGIGCHAPTRMVWNLPGEFERFVVTVGVDDAASPAGSVVFRILDGKGNELAKSPMMSPGTKPKRLVVSLAGVKQLVLVADSDVQLDVGDHADWADPRLVRPQR